MLLLLLLQLMLTVLCCRGHQKLLGMLRRLTLEKRLGLHQVMSWEWWKEIILIKLVLQH